MQAITSYSWCYREFNQKQTGSLCSRLSSVIPSNPLWSYPFSEREPGDGEAYDDFDEEEDDGIDALEDDELEGGDDGELVMLSKVSLSWLLLENMCARRHNSEAF